MEINETIHEYLENCLSNGFSSRTVMSYRSSLRPWQDFIAKRGIHNIHEVTRDHLLDYRNHLQTTYVSKDGQPLSVSTQGQKISTLRSYLDYCNKTGKTLINPSLDIPMPKKPKTLPRGILTKQQVKKLLKQPNIETPFGVRDRVILELFYATGIRRNELVSIRVEDCQINDRRLFIREGKGGKQRWLPLASKVCQILRHYIQDIRPQLLRGKTHNYLIVATQGGRIYGPNVYKIVKKYLNLIGADSDCHGMRHTCATHLLKGKANIRVIQSLLGHESLSSTEIYTHVDISDLTRAINKAHPRQHMELDY